MKVTLLTANCLSELLTASVQIVTKVLKELEVDIYSVQLHKLPYFEGKKTKQMDSVMNSINESDGVIAISSVPMLGIHGAMQSFFDNATLYSMDYFDKPVFAITYSKWLGEQEAAQMIQKAWNTLGGSDGGSICMNESLPHQPYLERLEKEIENFYRCMKQKKPNIGSSERMFYYNTRQSVPSTAAVKNQAEALGGHSEVRSFAEMIKNDEFAARLDRHSEELNREKSTQLEAPQHINLSTKEQTIKEIAGLIERETRGEEFTALQAGIYGRPQAGKNAVLQPKKLAQIPHYFASQYDKSLNLVLKYELTDLKEEGYIIIQEGDCLYEEQTEKLPTVEMILTEEVLQEILSKKITYQKAFMLGKLKVKGNFAVLPRLDQAFKAL